MTNGLLVLMSKEMLTKYCALKHNHVALGIRKTSFSSLKNAILHLDQFGIFSSLSSQFSYSILYQVKTWSQDFTTNVASTDCWMNFG